jgi:hypothetical protein
MNADLQIVCRRFSRCSWFFLFEELFPLATGRPDASGGVFSFTGDELISSNFQLPNDEDRRFGESIP